MRSSGLPRPRRVGDGDRVLPLINVVFLLLVFFMVAGRLASSDPFALAPPRSASDGPPPALRDVVQIGAEGERALDGRIMAEADLVAEIARRLARTPELAVRVMADGEAPALEVVALVVALRDAGATDVALVTRFDPARVP